MQRCGKRKTQTQIQRRCRSQFCKPVRFPPSLAAQAAAAPPQQSQRRRFTSHGFVSLRRCPCFPATHHQPNPIATNQFVPPENFPTPKPSQHRRLLGQTRRPSLPAAAAVPAPVAASPPYLWRRCHCFLPTRSTRKKSRPVQRSGKQLPNTIPSGCRSQSCKPARASLALQPRQPQPPRSRRSAAVPLHLRSVSLWRCPCFSAPLPPTNRFPRPDLSHPSEEFLHSPTHPFQWCEKQPQCPQAKAPDAS